MTGDARLRKALELTQLTRDLLLAGLRRRHPDLDDAGLREVYLRRLQKSWTRRE
jgi:hypothetical protein